MKNPFHIVLACIATLLATSCGRGRSVTIDLRERHQTIDGFGGFGPAKVWWHAPPYYDDAYLDRILDDLGVSILRTQIYWDAEPTNDNDDPNDADLSRFDYSESSDNGKQFAFIRALRQRGLDKLIASVWTPPIWMKHDPDDSLARFCHGQCGGRLDPAMRAEFAEYLVTYVKVLKRETGVDLYALSLQNELLFPNPFESCVYDASEFARTLEVVGARFRAEGLPTKIFGPEHMGSFDWNEESGLFGAALDDEAASRYLDIYAVHGYLDGAATDYGSAEGWSDMFERVNRARKRLWMTETSDDVSTYDRAWEMTRGMHLALAHGNISAWVYWYMSDSLLQNGRPGPLFYLFKSYYKFIRPGAVRVGASAADPDVLVTAFSEDDALTIVMMNNGSRPHTVDVHIEGRAPRGPFASYRTSARERFVATGTAALEAVVLPARSITTLVAGEPGPRRSATTSSVSRGRAR